MHANTVTPPSNRSRSKRRNSSAGQVRIIAGQWRGRKLPVADVTGLRPTGDRVRETLFNWLQRDMAGSRCLDLFAGSGALGFEALSRYATCVTFVEPDRQAFATLETSIRALNCGQPGSAGTSAAQVNSLPLDAAARPMNSDTRTTGMARAVNTTAQQFLSGNRERFDIVFIDPPFDAQLQLDMLLAVSPDHLADNALIYVEAPHRQIFPDKLPAGLSLTREKILGDVCARLLRNGSTDGR